MFIGSVIFMKYQPPTDRQTDITVLSVSRYYTIIPSATVQFPTQRLLHSRSADRKFAESIRRKPAQPTYDIYAVQLSGNYTPVISLHATEGCVLFIGSIDCCSPLVWFFSGSIRPTLSRPRPTSIFCRNVGHSSSFRA